MTLLISAGMIQPNGDQQKEAGAMAQTRKQRAGAQARARSKRGFAKLLKSQGTMRLLVFAPALIGETS